MQVLRLLFLAGACSAVAVNPLPAPRKIVWGDGPVAVANLTLTTNCSDVVSQAFGRMWSTVEELKWYPAATEMPYQAHLAARGAATTVSRVTISVAAPHEPLQLHVDETYTLRLAPDSDTIEITAATTWGALHALTTLQQLIIYRHDAFWLEGTVDIWDAPLFAHRGVMIDTARNFISKRKILEQIAALSLCKMNVLHWHLSDTQSWPVEMKVLPQMHRDAFSAAETYTHQDIKDVVAFGAARGVRIVPEVDMPGHSRAGWRQVNASLVSCGDAFWADVAVEPVGGQLDIANPAIYPVVAQVYAELSGLFPDFVFHVGADELQPKCYQDGPSMSKAWLKAANRTFTDLVQLWVDNTTPIFYLQPNRRVMMWEDVLLTTAAHTVPQSTILQSWNDDSNVAELTLRGYDVVVSSSDHLYLDCGYGGYVTNDPRYSDAPQNAEFNLGNGGLWCNPYKTWQRIYNYDFTKGLNATQRAHVLGAEAALWSEQVDSAVVTQKVWPRAAALAEITWSGNRDAEGHLRTSSASQRIYNFREYLVAQGIDASPLASKWCLQNPHACDLTLNQTALDEF